MKLWVLRPVVGLPKVRDNALNPWEPWYDKVFGFVIRAPDEATARQLADADAGDENHGLYGGEIAKEIHPWLAAHLSTCVLLAEESDGPAEVVIIDSHSA